MIGDGFNVTQLMPGYGREMTAETSPFLMMDYNAPWEVPAQTDLMQAFRDYNAGLLN